MTLKTTLITAALFAALATGASSIAQETDTDFSQLSNEELTQLRNQARSMSEEDRVRFQSEMQNRAQNMTPEEREQAGLGPANAAGRQGQGGDRGEQSRKRDGSGDQDRSMQRQRDGSGNNQSQGGGQQSRPRDGSGYGGGYQSRQGQGGRGGNR